MFYAMQFIPDEFNPRNVIVRAVRAKPFKSFDAAVRAVKKVGHQGYVKEYGKKQPVWDNLHA